MVLDFPCFALQDGRIRDGISGLDTGGCRICGFPSAAAPYFQFCPFVPGLVRVA